MHFQPISFNEARLRSARCFRDFNASHTFKFGITAKLTCFMNLQPDFAFFLILVMWGRGQGRCQRTQCKRAPMV